VLGEDSRDILAEHGYSSEEIDRLAAEHAVLLGA
jgi:crotonobetainyl-CoA:carnitine CoA-transferase CaiB-like acyl-CoA transferase